MIFLEFWKDNVISIYIIFCKCKEMIISFLKRQSIKVKKSDNNNNNNNNTKNYNNLVW